MPLPRASRAQDPVATGISRMRHSQSLQQESLGLGSMRVLRAGRPGSQDSGYRVTLLRIKGAGAWPPAPPRPPPPPPKDGSEPVAGGPTAGRVPGSAAGV